MCALGAVEVCMRGRAGGGQRCDNTFAWVLAVTPDISCAANSKRLRTQSAQVMPGNQTCRIESASSPPGELPAHKTYPPARPLKIEA